MKNIIQFALVILIAGGAGFGVQRYLQQEDRHVAPIMPKADSKSIIGTARPALELIDTDEKLRNIDEWNDKVLLVNFWATWCPPCKKEMPAFIELQEQYAAQGFQVIGVAIDDMESVRDFVDTLGVNYPALVAEHAGIKLSREYGNHLGALPYSVFVGRDGVIIHTHTGELSKQQVEDIISPLLKR